MYSSKMTSANLLKLISIPGKMIICFWRFMFWLTLYLFFLFLLLNNRIWIKNKQFKSISRGWFETNWKYYSFSIVRKAKIINPMSNRRFHHHSWHIYRSISKIESKYTQIQSFFLSLDRRMNNNTKNRICSPSVLVMYRMSIFFIFSFFRVPVYLCWYILFK